MNKIINFKIQSHSHLGLQQSGSTRFVRNLPLPEDRFREEAKTDRTAIRLAA
ncbi:hypothetical protein [Paenibacillus sabinae]|uniref:hypothetical protein n=1 Tax=Paenibacillus sabinae TaxID=365617 RepID=UPI000B2482DA|nr:hypothetical protein [Paenibacillus sabinae]